jgi:predicted dehydrogenase
MISRRSFLTKSSALAFGASLIPASALGLDGNIAASERIAMGLIGCGSHGGGWNLMLMTANPMQQVVAVCDVDEGRMNETRMKAEKTYSEKMGAAYKGCTAHGDFRDLVNRKDVDAVCIVTPDHWHVLMAVFAMKAGKDVICEKPTLTIEEGRILSDVQKKTQRVYQTASENRSIDSYQYIVNAARNGHLGELRNIKVLLPPGNTAARNTLNKDEQAKWEVADAPKGLNYDLWLGPAPVKPYIEARTHYNWRWNFDYSGGVLTDWGSHLVNIGQWANNSDDTGPVEVQGTGDFPNFDEPWNTPPTFKIHCRYATGVTMEIWSEVPGIKLEGTKGWLLMRGWRGPITASDDSLLNLKFEGDKNLGRPESTVPAKGGTGGEHIDFANCVKSRKPCYYTAECGHRNHSIAHIANISMLLGGAKLKWNPQTEKFEGDRADEANKHFCATRPQREPWSFAKVDSWINVG